MVESPRKFLQVSIYSIDIDAIVPHSETGLVLILPYMVVSFSLDTSAQFHSLLPQFL